MTERATKPKYLQAWHCPRCGTDCSDKEDHTNRKDGEDCVGYWLTCNCGCVFMHVTSITYAPYGVQVDGVTHEYPQVPNDADVSAFVDEYNSLLDGIPEGEEHDDDRAGRLCTQAEWTADGVKILVDLARTYGSFVLRNALALALAMGVEDGTSEI